MRARKFSWTYHIPDGEDFDSVCANIKEDNVLEETTYSIYNKEICPTTGKFHLQGFSYFKYQYGLLSAKERLQRGFNFDNTIHLEYSGGTIEDNISYCSKNESAVGPYTEFGERPATKKKTDVAVIKDLIKEGLNIQEIMKHNDFTLNFNNLKLVEKLITLNEPSRPVAPIEVIWIWGKSGIGKTRYVFDKYPHDEVYRPVNYKWWDGYDSHKIVLIDDYRKSFCSFNELLTLTDIYPFRVEIKGGSRQVAFTTLIFTSPRSPESTWESIAGEEKLEQLTRRITKVIHLE